MGEVGYIYILTDASGLYKIGRAQDVKKRLRHIRGCNPTIEHIHSFWTNNMIIAERKLHKRYDNSRMLGEWFRLHPAQVAYLQKIEQMEFETWETDIAFRVSPGLQALAENGPA